MTYFDKESERRRLESILGNFKNHQRWCEDSLVIRDQRGAPVPFRTFPGPKKLNDAIEKQRRKGKPVRIIYLKARRIFVSAGTSTHGFKHCAFLPGRHGMVIAHQASAAKEIFQYYEDFAKWYKGQVQLSPRADAGNREGEMMRWTNDSYIRVATAGSKNIGRAMGLHFLDISEAAFIERLAKVKLGLLNTMGDDQDNMVVEESTANGAAGDFYEDWIAASDNRADSFGTRLAWWSIRRTRCRLRFHLTLPAHRSHEEKKTFSRRIHSHWSSFTGVVGLSEISVAGRRKCLRRSIRPARRKHF